MSTGIPPILVVLIYHENSIFNFFVQLKVFGGERTCTPEKPKCLPELVFQGLGVPNPTPPHVKQVKDPSTLGGSPELFAEGFFFWSVFGFFRSRRSPVTHS